MNEVSAKHKSFMEETTKALSSLTFNDDIIKWKVKFYQKIVLARDGCELCLKGYSTRPHPNLTKLNADVKRALARYVMEYAKGVESKEKDFCFLQI